MHYSRVISIVSVTYLGNVSMRTRNPSVCSVGTVRCSLVSIHIYMLSGTWCTVYTVPYAFVQVYSVECSGWEGAVTPAWTMDRSCGRAAPLRADSSPADRTSALKLRNEPPSSYSQSPTKSPWTHLLERGQSNRRP